jgi:hypothetical protein
MHPIADRDVRLAEFERLRAEIDHRTAIQQALIALNVTVAGTILGFVAAEKAPDSLLLAIVFISNTFGILWLDHHLAIHQIAGYIKNELWDWQPSWESYLDNDKKPLWWRVFFMFAIIMVFVGVAFTAAVAVKSNLHQCALVWVWWIGAMITAVSLITFVAVFSMGPARLK